MELQQLVQLLETQDEITRYKQVLANLNKYEVFSLEQYKKDNPEFKDQMADIRKVKHSIKLSVKEKNIPVPEMPTDKKDWTSGPTPFLLELGTEMIDIDPEAILAISIKNTQGKIDGIQQKITELGGPLTLPQIEYAKALLQIREVYKEHLDEQLSVSNEEVTKEIKEKYPCIPQEGIDFIIANAKLGDSYMKDLITKVEKELESIK